MIGVDIVDHVFNFFEYMYLTWCKFMNSSLTMTVMQNFSWSFFHRTEKAKVDSDPRRYIVYSCVLYVEVRKRLMRETNNDWMRIVLMILTIYTLFEYRYMLYGSILNICLSGNSGLLYHIIIHIDSIHIFIIL